jgi:hypothetical protein
MPVSPAEPDLDQVIAKVIAEAAEMLQSTRLERARRAGRARTPPSSTRCCPR